MSNPIPEPTELSPEAVIEQLHAMQSQLKEIAPLTKEQSQLLKKRIRFHSPTVVEASINVLGVMDNVAQAIGQPLGEVRRLQDDQLRWDAAAAEARAFLQGIEGANLIRRQQLTLIGMQAYTIGAQLAKDPAKAVLVPHLEEIKRMKGAARRKKSAPTPQK